MESFKKIGQACRQHYEKILLSGGLLALAFAVIYLYVRTQEELERNREKRDYSPRQVSGIKPFNSKRTESALDLVARPPALKFSGPHNLFNPIQWQRKPDGSLVKIVSGEEIGMAQMTVTRITPLNYIVSLDRVPSPGGYIIGVVREAAEKVVDRRKKQKFATLNSPADFFTLREIKGPPEDPAELVLELADSKDRISVLKDKPYTRVDGYEADLKYAIDGRAFTNLRLGSSFRFLNKEYGVVAIKADEVVVADRANDRHHSIRLPAGK